MAAQAFFEPLERQQSRQKFNFCWGGGFAPSPMISPSVLEVLRPSRHLPEKALMPLLAATPGP